ncbi:MAG TPA: squalene synthase HpnC [Burkholderiales bacterium]|nr:squalene synthase HpnC [Burkholderiales bacterium]
MPINSCDHYENFPVGSILLPSALRAPISVIYRFARSADDIADEGEANAPTRLAQLDGYREALNRIEEGAPSHDDLFATLAQVIAQYNLPIQLFRDLIDAFSQDVVKTRYATFTELLDYCRRSADPIGRLLLHLFKASTPQNLAYSDAICSSLQLINFWQDVAIDWNKARIYIPQEDMAAYGVTESHIADRQVDARWQRLMRFQIERSRAMLESGAALGRVLPGRMGLEIRTIIAGGATILNKLEMTGGDMFHHRPVLTIRDWPFILYRAFYK